MKHGTLVTLYKPSAAQIDHLLGLPAHSPAVVAIDNSPVVDRELHARLAAHGVDVVQKAAGLAALEQQRPTDRRAGLARQKELNDAIAQIDKAQKSNATPDEMRAQLAQTLGPEAAERVVKMQQADNAWHAKYDEYAAQRARIDAQNLSTQDRDAQVAQ